METDPHTAIQLYADEMSQLKPRIDLAEAIAARRIRVERYPLTEPPTIIEMPFRQAVESIAVQLRMSLECIVFASLVANRNAYAAERADYANHWNAGRMVKRLRRLNLGFYPHPISSGPPVNGMPHIVARPGDDYLSEAEFVPALDRLGTLCHAPNPFGPQPNYAMVLEELERLRIRITNLLNVHVVHLADAGDELWVIEMKVDDLSDRIRWTKWYRLGTQAATSALGRELGASIIDRR